jgi:hypothetical protein
VAGSICAEVDFCEDERILFYKKYEKWLGGHCERKEGEGRFGNSSRKIE